MEILNSLSGPIAQRLTWTLLHFLWQGAILAGLLETAAYLLGVRAMAARYRMTLATLMLMAACPAVTFCLVRPHLVSAPDLEARSHALRGNELTAAPRPRDKTSTQSVGTLRSHAERGNATELAAPLKPEAPARPVAPSLAGASGFDHRLPPVSLLARWQPGLLGGWAIGAGLFALRLLAGGGMAWWLRRGRLPLDQAWADRATRLARRMGLARARVFVSVRVCQALATGIWRPMVLLPAAWLAEMPPEMLEGVLAHELAHLRRLDLWAILLQRLVETLLFYHPAVWWLSRRLSREREMCCDEMAVAAIGDRLAFTKALQWAVQQPAAGGGPVLGAAWKGSRKMVLERIRRILGAETPRERFSWWPLGLAALAAPALLMLSGVFAKDGPKPAKAAEDRTPTLAEIAKANDAAWAAIHSFDVEYEMTSSLIVDGKQRPQTQSPGVRWLKEGKRERLRGRMDTPFVFDIADCDTYCDGKNEYTWGLEHENPKAIRGKTYEGKAYGFSSFMLCLRRFEVVDKGELRWPTLAQLIASGGVTMRGKQASQDGDTLWVLEVDDPMQPYAATKNRTFKRIYVNADKGFLISRVAYRLPRSDAASPHGAADERNVIEIVKFTDCGHGVFFPSIIKQQGTRPDGWGPGPKIGFNRTYSATRLSVNAPLPGDAFDFRFPDQAVVYHYDANGKAGKVSIWGPDNKPVREFATQKDYTVFTDPDLAKTRKEVEAKRESKEPEDLMERAQYYLVTKDFDKALSALEALIAADPNSEMAASAHTVCGQICLLRDRDFGRAATEFSETLRWLETKNAAEKGKNNVQTDLRAIFFLRGLAYANQTDGLDKALADMTTVIGNKLRPDQGALPARVVRSAIYLRCNELDKARRDIAVVLNSDFQVPHIYGISSLIYAKQGDHAKAEADRMTFAAKWAVAQRPSASLEDSSDLCGGMLNLTLLRLVPALEDLAPVQGASVPKVPAEPPPLIRTGNGAAKPPRPAALCDMSLTLGRVGDDVVLARDLFHRIDDTMARSQVPPEKRDEQRAALVKEVTDAICDYAAHVAAGDRDPAKGMSNSHRALLYNMVRQSLDVKMLYQDFRKEVPKDGQMEIKELVDRCFDETQVKALMMRENVTTLADLESALGDKGSSLERERKSFTEQFIAQQWIVQKVKRETGPGTTHEDMKRQEDFLKELRDKYPIWTVFDAAMKPAQKQAAPTLTARAYGTAAKPATPAKRSPAADAVVLEVKVTVLAVDRAKLGTSATELQRLGVDLDRLPASLDADKSEAIMTALLHDGVAEVLMRPQIAALSGDKASVSVGPTFLEILPTVLDKDRVRVECHLRKKSPTATFEFEAPLEMRLGRTLVASGGRLQPPNSDEQIVVLMTAKLPDDKVKQSPRARVGHDTASEDYRIEPPDVVRVEVTQFPGRKTVLEGLYLVGPDGTINLRQYGAADVAGLTGREAERRIAEAVSHAASGSSLGELSARVEIAAYNSKFVYVFYEENNGDCVARVPANNSSTVASAVLQVEGAAAKAAKVPVWLWRAPRVNATNPTNYKIKQIDWRAIVQRGSVEANLRVLPGDRIYIGRRPAEKSGDVSPPRGGQPSSEDHHYR